MQLHRLGAIRLNAAEAMTAMQQRLKFGDHMMDSPRDREGRDFRISASRERMTQAPIITGKPLTPGFKFFKRLDIRDTARCFNEGKFMDEVGTNYYSMENIKGRFREHRIEVAGTTLESILGLGAIYEQTACENLQDMPDIVALLEKKLKAMKTDFRGCKASEEIFKWSDYDEIWGFQSIPRDHPEREKFEKAFKDRMQGKPTGLNKGYWPAFYRRMEDKGTQGHWAGWFPAQRDTTDLGNS
jgi:hypothetical protein